MEMILADDPKESPQHRKHCEGFIPQSKANMAHQVREHAKDFFLVATAWEIVEWDGEDWIHHGPHSKMFKALQHLIKPQFIPLCLK